MINFLDYFDRYNFIANGVGYRNCSILRVSRMNDPVSVICIAHD